MWVKREPTSCISATGWVRCRCRSRRTRPTLTVNVPTCLVAGAGCARGAATTGRNARRSLALTRLPLLTVAIPQRRPNHSSSTRLASTQKPRTTRPRRYYNAGVTGSSCRRPSETTTSGSARRQISARSVMRRDRPSVTLVMPCNRGGTALSPASARSWSGRKHRRRRCGCLTCCRSSRMITRASWRTASIFPIPIKHGWCLRKMACINQGRLRIPSTMTSGGWVCRLLLFLLFFWFKQIILKS